MKRNKRKDLSPVASKSTAKQQKVCIIHTPKIQHGSFTAFSDIDNARERLDHLHEIRDQRLAEPMTSSYRMTEICQEIPNQVHENQGYHRGCYQRFTMNLHRLQSSSPSTSQTSSATKNRSQRKNVAENIIFSPDCIFCNKSGRISAVKDGISTKQGTSSFERDGWQRIQQIAEENQHEWLLCRIRGYDLFASEAKYHPKCRKKYASNPKYWRSSNPETSAKQSDIEAAHKESFEYVAKYVQDNIVIGRKVIQLSSLCMLYISKLDESPYANPNYRAEKLKRKLEMHPDLGPTLAFTKIQPEDNTWPFYLVYSSSISVGEAINQTYNLASKDAIKDVALLLRGIILKAFKESKELTWPPSANDLQINDEVIPPTLNRFLSLVISGAPRAPSNHAERLIYSIGQDLCRAVSNGEWKLPKHILLCMSLRHLYRSKQLLTLMNRLGHCESYNFSLEMETAVAESLEQTSSLLTSRILPSPANELFHSEWDNFDQLLTGIHGRPSFNVAAGIMLQETTNHEEIQSSFHTNLPSIPRTKHQRLSVAKPTSLPPFHITKKISPVMEFPTIHQSSENDVAYQKALKVFLIWVLSRKASSTDKQVVPALAGFISATGHLPDKLTTIDYYPSITQPITEYSVVKELLHQCEKATEQVGQKYTVITFDLGVVMKAMPIIWRNPECYKNHIILIGTFHTIMNYLNMLGHKMAGSGYSEIIIEANLTTSGCLKGVLSGKSYNKSLWCVKTVSEALERLLLSAYTENTETSPPSTLESLINECNEDTLTDALQDPTVITFLDGYLTFQDKVRSGMLGKTAQFWMSFLDHARRIFMLIYAVKKNDLKLYHKCMADMTDLFFSFGGYNYARYLCWYDVFLTNLEISHPGATQLLEKGAISVTRSLIPDNRSAVDKTMEETFMRFAKSRCGASGAGLTGILENYGAYHRWIRTTSERSKYYQATLNMTGMSNDTDSTRFGKHREQLKPEIARSEAAVQRTLDAVNGFLNPFDIPDKHHLYILSSGNSVPPDVETDVLKAEKAGRTEKEKFVQERLKKDSNGEKKDLFDRIKKLNLKTMEKANKKVKLTSDKGNVIKYQEQGDAAFQILLRSQMLNQPVSIEELMNYSITPVPHCIGTPDGFMAKTNKATPVHYLTNDLADNLLPSASAGETLFIEDGNAHFHALKDVPSTFKDICLKVFDSLSYKPDVVFSTDMYLENSIKSQERMRRGCSDKILLDGFNTRKPADFKTFLQNDENKKQLFQLMLRVWSCPEIAPRLMGRKVILVIEGACFLLTSLDGKTVQVEELQSLRSTQEETDTRVVLYLLYAQKKGYKQAVVRSPDSDLFFIMLHYAEQLKPMTIFLDTGSGVNKRLLNITDIAQDLGPKYCTSLLGLYCFTGEDCNCAFKGKGKVGPLKKLEKKPRYQDCFAKLGNRWEVDDKLVNDLEEFVCLMYGFPRSKHVNMVRALMLKKMVGENMTIKASSRVDLAKLPPCKSSLDPHIKRTNYRVAQFKQAHIPMPEIPAPTKEHGWVTSGNFIEPVWSEGPMLPPSLHGLLEAATEKGSNDDDDDDLFIDEQSHSDSEESDSDQY